MGMLSHRRSRWTVLALVVVSLPLVAGMRDFSTPDQITLARQGGGTPVSPVVLFHGWRDGQCREFELLPSLDAVGDASKAGTPDCPAWTVAFADGSAPVVNRQLAWTVLGSQKVLALSVAPPVPVGINVWVVTNVAGGINSWPAVQAKQSVVDANAVFLGGKVGVTLGLHQLVVFGRSAPEAAVIGNGCGRANDLRNNPTLYVKDELNVYFVSTIRLPVTENGINRGEEDSWEVGRNCGAYGAPEIIYIDYDEGTPGALSHEIGHGLGLWEPDGGHTDNVAGLKDINNFMLDGWASDGGLVSLGQAFRMQFDTRSWLNRAFDVTTRPFFISCQTTKSLDWPCPHLALDVPRNN